MRGDLEAVRALLRDGADVNEAQGDGMTALHWAARRGEAELAEVLVYAGAKLDAGTRIGRYTPLHIAAREAKVEVAEILLEAGANVTAVTTNSGVTPLHLAARSGHASIVSALIEAGAEVDARERSWGQTPLTFAAAMNRAEAIEVLLRAGADPDATAESRDVVEMAAADQAADDRLQEALERFKAREGGGPDWQPTPSQVQAAIDLARRVQQRWPDVPRDDEDETADEDGEPSQEAAPAEVADSSATAGAADAAGGPAPQGGATPEAGATPDPTAEGSDADAGEGVTALADSASAGEGEANEEDEEPRPLSYAQQVGQWGGLTPLHHAVRQGHVEATRALLEGGAVIDRRTGDGTTPLLMAAINGQWDLATLLLDRGADPNLVSEAGATPLYTVLERQWQPRASYAHPDAHQRQETTHLQMMERLLEAGADPNARLTRHLWYMEYTFGVLRGSGIHLDGATPFWRAAYALDVEAMRLLAAHGADPDIWTKKPPERRRRGQMEETDSTETAETDSTGAVPGEGASADSAAGSSEADAAGAQSPSAVAAQPMPGAPGQAQHVATRVATPVLAPTAAVAAVASEQAADEGEGEEAEEEEDEDKSGLPPVPAGGPAIHPVHAAAGVGYGQSFAGNAHRYVPNGWMAAVRFLIEEMGADVNARDANGYTALHHAASRGDIEMIRYLVEEGADVTVVSRKGETTADMANGPVQRVQPYPEAIALLERLGSENNHNCVSCQ